jgi:hypothetical protein
MNYRAQLGKELGSPIIDLGTTRRARADKRMRDEVLPFYPDAVLLEGGPVTQAVPVQEQTLDA